MTHAYPAIQPYSAASVHRGLTRSLQHGRGGAYERPQPKSTHKHDYGANTGDNNLVFAAQQDHTKKRVCRIERNTTKK